MSAPTCLLSTEQEINNCKHFLREKILHHSSLSPNNRSVSPLEILVADLMGPFDVMTIHGGHYALNIRNMASTYGEFHILLNKSNAST
ncbi:hypothetical protein O181_013581 [Austropuccinia psidii MF-1]|uniref:Uncharacterized protein n=1 Tax=Austropuccinia psidii MF-1 TaxID=1389203 RepID=A0A9Q3BWN5_9BASI|nr:hypothetical protein [Austropuccinia psidii MF-1]